MNDHEKYEAAYVLAAIRARKRGINFAVMRTVFGGYTVFPAVDTGDYSKYEIVYPDSPIVLV